MAPALAIPLLAVPHLRQADTAGPFGAVGYTVNVVGLGLFGGAAFALNLVLFQVDQPVVDALLDGPTRFALLGSAVVFAIGSVLFGIAMVRARTHPRVPAVAYVVALPVLALAAPLPDSVLTSAVHAAAGTTVAWLAAALWKSWVNPVISDCRGRRVGIPLCWRQPRLLTSGELGDHDTGGVFNEGGPRSWGTVTRSVTVAPQRVYSPAYTQEE